MTKVVKTAIDFNMLFDNVYLFVQSTKIPRIAEFNHCQTDMLYGNTRVSVSHPEKFKSHLKGKQFHWFVCLRTK